MSIFGNGNFIVVGFIVSGGESCTESHTLGLCSAYAMKTYCVVVSEVSMPGAKLCGNATMITVLVKFEEKKKKIIIIQ